MTPDPDPESEWREWYRREYECEPSDHSVTRGAYLAAAKRRDALGELEREWIESTYAYFAEWMLATPYPESPPFEDTPFDRLHRAYVAMRAVRTPAPVDRLRTARDLLAAAARFAIQDEARAKMEEARDHITAELQAREKTK